MKVGGHVYSISGTTHRPTELVCTDLATGETVWAEEGFGSGALMAADSGKTLWKAGPFRGNAAKIDRLASMRHLNLTVSAQGVFLIDEKCAVALDLSSGKEKWRAERLIQPIPSGKKDPGSLYHLLNNQNRHTVVADGERLFILHPSDPTGMKHTGPGIVQALEELGLLCG